MNYCISLTNYVRNRTIEVQIGNVPLGDTNYIRLQSMTNTNTLDIDKTLEQTLKIINEGADYVRITTPALQDVDALKKIKEKLRENGIQTPLIADIHFNVKAAYAAAEVVEKIRVNPGNFAFSSTSRQNELENIKENFLPLLEICKKKNTAIRIGTNHGSLSKRIIEKFGDTPQGMVEATMEFLRICCESDFKNIVISLKSSNTVVMVQACRLLVAKMQEENMNFPIHLGVTEAGDGEDGRIKSAIGIGALLVDGIGDTIRVSLTEAPEKEIPVSKHILKYSTSRKNSESLEEIDNTFFNPFSREKNKNFSVKNIGSGFAPIIISDISENVESLTGKILSLDKNFYPDYFFIGNNKSTDLPENFNYITENQYGKNQKNIFPLFTFTEFLQTDKKSDELNFIKLNYKDIKSSDFNKINNNSTVVFVLKNLTDNLVGEIRLCLSELIKNKCKNPIIIQIQNTENSLIEFQLKASVDLSVFLIDDLLNGIYIQNSKISNQDIIKTSFAILQASRLRISKTEFISCPSCGRTLFDIEEALSKIKNRTYHLKGLKIAVMGCIVNGPGEMSDADYGYVGAGNAKITLYKNKEIIKKNIPEEEAVDELISIIKLNNDWQEEEK